MDDMQIYPIGILQSPVRLQRSVGVNFSTNPQVIIRKLSLRYVELLNFQYIFDTFNQVFICDRFSNEAVCF
jgi:hypothetical protein